MTDKVTPTQADAHLAQVISAVFDKPIPVEAYKEVERLIARHASQALAEGLAEGKLIGARLGLAAAYQALQKQNQRLDILAESKLIGLAFIIRALSPADVVKGGE